MIRQRCFSSRNQGCLEVSICPSSVASLWTWRPVIYILWICWGESHSTITYSPEVFSTCLVQYLTWSGVSIHSCGLGAHSMFLRLALKSQFACLCFPDARITHWGWLYFSFSNWADENKITQGVKAPVIPGGYRLVQQRACQLRSLDNLLQKDFPISGGGW